MTDARRLDDCQAAALLFPVSAANTAAATSGAGLWLDISNFVGQVLVTQLVGLLTGTPGSFAGQLQCASDVNGTGAVNITGATFTSIILNNPGALASQIYAIDAAQCASGKSFIGYVGTVTGFTAVLVGVSASGRKRSN
jgi:hypothetical protein